MSRWSENAISTPRSGKASANCLTRFTPSESSKSARVWNCLGDARGYSRVQMSAIYLVEGVAGSGKDTLTAQLVAWLQPERRHVQVFAEEAVLASWLHYFVPWI